jgi:hypothetical protein
MTGYQARWDTSPVTAGVLTMFARTIRTIAAIESMESVESRTQHPLVSRGSPSEPIAPGRALHAGAGRGTDSGSASNSNAASRANPQPLSDSPLNLPDETPSPSEANGPTHRASKPVAVAIEPVLSKPEDWSDLIALAGDGHGTVPGDLLRSASESPAPEVHGHARGSSFWPAGMGEAGALESDTSEVDPLATLTREYRDALLSQKSGNTRALKAASSNSNGRATTPQHDPFDELAPRSHAESSVFELLTHGRNIDTLLDSLDAFGSDQIFAADQAHEILMLLAPRGLSPRHTTQAAQLAREEHHMVSMDSHLSVPDSTEYEETKSPDEHDR